MTVNQFEIQVTPPERTNVAWYNPQTNELRFFVNGEWKESSAQSDWNQEDSTKVDYIKNKPNVSKKIVVDSINNITGEQWESMNSGDIIEVIYLPGDNLYQVIYTDKSSPDHKNIQVNMSSLNSMYDNSEYYEYKAFKDGNNWTIQSYSRSLSNPLEDSRFCLDWGGLVKGKTPDSNGWVKIDGSYYGFEYKPFILCNGRYMPYDIQQGFNGNHQSVLDILNDYSYPDEFVGNKPIKMTVFGYVDDWLNDGITGRCEIVVFIRDNNNNIFTKYFSF